MHAPRALVLKPHEVAVDASAIWHLKDRFDHEQCVVLEGLLEPALLELLRPRLEQTAWSDFRHGEIGTEVVSADGLAHSLLHFAINAPAAMDAIRKISGCDDITWFDGRIFRMDPNVGHYDSWHDDFVHGRLVGMSVNLSFEGYEGGEFEIRRKNDSKVLGRIANRVPGNASLFKLGADLEHRVAPLAGMRARTAFAGWFRRGERDLLTRLRR